MRSKASLACLLAVLCWSATLASIDHIVDGDTLDVTAVIWLAPDGRPLLMPERVRLLGVNAPESNKKPTQVAGRAAAAFTRTWLAARPLSTLVLTLCGRDAFGRALAQITAPDGTLSDALLASGHAVRFP
jgi:endonuclease YncB( thermonuclease family)